MGRYLIKRILTAIPILIGISIITFMLVYLAPGNAADMMVTPDMEPEVRESIVRNLGLDAPWHVQYGTWLNNILHGNLGFSFNLRLPVSRLIGERIVSTFTLVGVSLIFGVLIAIPLGILSAVKADYLLDRILAVFSYTGVSAPNFLISLVLIFVFSIKLKLLPSSGMHTIGMKGNVNDLIKHLIMPGFTLGLVTVCRFTRYVKTFMLEVLSEDYLRTAAAKGASRLSRIFVHAFRNAFLPLITLISLEIPTLFGGSVVVEQIFSWPGIGRLAMDAVHARDYPMIMGVTLITAVLVVMSSLISDIVCSLADPRIRDTRSAR